MNGRDEFAVPNDLGALLAIEDGRTLDLKQVGVRVGTDYELVT